MSLFKKPKKNIVQRRVFTEIDDDEDEPMEVQEAAPIEKNPKKRDKSKQKQTLLSFDAEEEGEVFQVKKSSHSKKIMKMFEKEKRKKDVKPEKEEPKSKVKTEIVTDDLVLVVNSSHKKPDTPPPPILSGRDALCAGKNKFLFDKCFQTYQFCFQVKMIYHLKKMKLCQQLTVFQNQIISRKFWNLVLFQMLP